jgi:GNAT superfamily N-acetyltransferase
VSGKVKDEMNVPGISGVPRDPFHRIGEVLNHDRPWSLYALGDLAPEEQLHCEWRFTSHDPPAATLFYQAFDPPVFFAIGAAVSVERLLDEAPLPSSLYLHIKHEILNLVNERYRRVTTKVMQRMILREAALADLTGVEMLAAGDLKDLAQLYGRRDGKEKEGTFFSPAQVLNGLYFGIRDYGRLVAAAGTHLINRSKSVAAVGNVFCLPEYRGNGLGARLTSAVVKALLKEGIQTIGLNVSPENPATRLYERLGFRKACSYVEGVASLRE